MKYFYSIDGENREGPLDLEELKQRELKRNSLVWKEGLDDWVSADSLPELREIFPIEPPPLPPKAPANVEPDIKPNLGAVHEFDKLTIDDRKLTVDRDALFVGILILVLPIVMLIFMAQTTDTLETKDIDKASRALIWFSLLAILILVSNWAGKIAFRLNRKKLPWNIAGFIFPGPTLIAISLMRKKDLVIELEDFWTKESKLNHLMTLAKKYFNLAMNTETIKCCNAALEIDSDSAEARILNSQVLLRLNDLKEAELVLNGVHVNSQQYKEALYLLALIKKRKGFTQEANNLFEKASELGHKGARQEIAKVDLIGKYNLSIEDVRVKIPDYQNGYSLEFITVKKGAQCLLGEQGLSSEQGKVYVCQNGIVVHVMQSYGAIMFEEIVSVGAEREKPIYRLKLKGDCDVVLDFGLGDSFFSEQLMNYLKRHGVMSNS